MTVLVTGFEPFGGSATNPSQRIVESLDDVEKALLPVSYARAADELRRAVREAAPEVVICFGQADGRAQISIERFAHNLDESSTTDNDARAGLRSADRSERACGVSVDAAGRRDRRRSSRGRHSGGPVARRGRVPLQPRLLRADARARAGAAQRARRLRARAASPGAGAREGCSDHAARDAVARGADDRALRQLTRKRPWMALLDGPRLTYG